LLDEGYDVSIVLASELPDSGFVSQRLGITYSIACASPDYVKAKGCAQRPHDLLNHACLRLVSPVVLLDKWSFNGPDGQESVAINTSPFLVNSADAMKTAITSGMGVGLLPVYAAIEGLRNGTLVRVMPNYRSQELNLYAIYPSRQYLDAKIKTWVEYLRGSLPEILAAHQAELVAYELSGSLGGVRMAN
jgi:DNA-binding transcriptional LysR family regulator